MAFSASGRVWIKPLVQCPAYTLINWLINQLTNLRRAYWKGVVDLLLFFEADGIFANRLLSQVLSL